MWFNSKSEFFSLPIDEIMTAYVPKAAGSASVAMPVWSSKKSIPFKHFQTKSEKPMEASAAMQTGSMARDSDMDIVP